MIASSHADQASVGGAGLRVNGSGLGAIALHACVIPAFVMPGRRYTASRSNRTIAHWCAHSEGPSNTSPMILKSAI